MEQVGDREITAWASNLVLDSTMHDMKNEIYRLASLASSNANDSREEASNSARRLYQWLDRVADLLRSVDANSLSLPSPAPVRVDDLMRQTHHMDDVQIDGSVATQQVVVVDYLAVSVIHNLVTNAHNAARRAGRKPSVHVSVSPLGTDRVAIDVRDSGPGISQSVQSNLFRSAVPSAEGSGIGLLIGRYLVELWGGTLELMHSQPGDTLFRVTFPKDAVVHAVALLEVPQHATP